MSRTAPTRVLKAVDVEGAARTIGRRRTAPAPVVAPVSGGMAASAPLPGPPAAPEAVVPAGDVSGYEEGFARGQREGLAEAAQQVEQATREAVESAQAELRSAREAERQRIDAALAEHAALTRHVLEQVQQHVTGAMRQIEEQAVAIAYEAVCRIVGDAAVEADAVRTIVTRALAELDGKPALGVRLHPRDLATLQASPDGQALLQGFAAVSWTADHGVSMGGCMVDSAAGTLDARLEVQLLALGQAWRNAATEVRSS
ncbi:FliH/SctL family protein [Cupriavidus sp. SW-Y-13]|uniref:FliH/SctL family protein n=1 Tax=Cupriavidus sp. SW-Y-13 TaxID=2653854 RepID=UPI0013657E97|nr:FliH/SctL family protein [Cupriavidus sp. SW-Y-13]MWL90524.1 hypothetical protein [Cupriavidus sp. SW-Y-13]